MNSKAAPNCNERSCDIVIVLPDIRLPTPSCTSVSAPPFWTVSIYENPCIMCMCRSSAHWNLIVLWLTSVQVFILYFQPTWFKVFIYIRTVSCGYGDPQFLGSRPQTYIDTPSPYLWYGDPYLYTIFFCYCAMLRLCLTASSMSLTIINADAIN